MAWVSNTKYVAKLKKAQKKKEIDLVKYQLSLATDEQLVSELNEKLLHLMKKEVKNFKRVNR